jgi:HSP20 family protein
MVRSLSHRESCAPRLLDVSRLMESPGLFRGFRQEMDRLWDEVFGGGDGGQQEWFAPRVNIAETEKVYEISLELPGVKPEDFAVEVKDGHLWISGHRKEETREEGKTYHRVESQYGEFHRAIPLDESIDADKIEATYKDGVLHLTIPKEESAQPRRIEVKT